MSTSFIGRERELAGLDRELAAVRSERGRMVALRGRRRVGKSTLVQQFVASANSPHVFFSAPRHETRPGALAQFVTAVRESTLPAAELATDVSVSTWDAALRLAVQGATGDKPVTIVIDELPYLLESDRAAGAELQHCWDRVLSQRPVLLVLIGSDIGMMERVTGHDGELFGRPSREPRVDPLTPGETARLLGLEDPADALDAYLVCGGFPVLAEDWPAGMSVRDHLAEQLRDDNNLLVAHGQRILDAEFEAEIQARSVLEAVGSGERTFTSIQRRLSLDAATTVTRAVERLRFKRVLDVPERLDGTGWHGERRYLVADTYLRFWLRFIGPHLPEIERGQGARTLQRIERDFATYRGKAIEPVVHDALLRMIGPWPDLAAVGGWWTRTNDPEIDVVGVDAMPRPTTVPLVGSIKWREHKAFTAADTRALAAVVDRVPGTNATTALIGVSRRGFTRSHGLDHAVQAADILAATAP